MSTFTYPMGASTKWSRASAALVVGAFCLLTDLVPGWADTQLAAQGVPDGDLRESGFVYQVHVTGGIARIVARQSITNRGSDEAVAIYRFDLPADAALIDARAHLASGWTTAEIVDAESAVVPAGGAESLQHRASPDAVLVRMMERDDTPPDPADGGLATYELRLFPLPAGRNATVEVTWLAPLRLDDGRLSLRIPGRGDSPRLVTEQVEVTLKPASGVTRYRNLVVGGRLLAKAPGSTRHDTLASRGGDTVIEVTPELGAGAHVSYATVSLGKGLGALAVQAWMPRPTGRSPLDPDRVLLVVDVSASMGKSGVAAAQQLVATLLAAVPEDARVDLVTFDRTARRALGALEANDHATRKAISAALAPPADAKNGSDLGAALDLVRTATRHDEDKHGPGRTLVVIIGDGMTPLHLIGARAIDRIGAPVIDRGQVVAITLVPDAVATPDTTVGPAAALASRTGGRSLAIRVSGVAERAPTLAAELRRPAPLDRLSIDAGAGTRVDDLPLPKRLEAGRGFTSVGLYHGKAPTSISLVAHAGGKTVRLRGLGDSSLRAAAAPLAVLWADAVSLRASGDSIADDGRNATATAARKARVVTPMAALVGVDSHDGFARDRLAMTRRWGPQVFTRMPPPPELRAAADLGSFSVSPSLAVPAGVDQRRTGSLDRAIIARLIGTHVMPKARACYQRALKAHPRLAGSVVLYLELARGEVQWAEAQRSTFPDAGMEACIADAGYSIRVPRVAQGDDPEAIGVVTYPLAFRRKDGAADVSRSNRPPPVTVDPNAPL